MCGKEHLDAMVKRERTFEEFLKFLEKISKSYSIQYTAPKRRDTR